MDDGSDERPPAGADAPFRAAFDHAAAGLALLAPCGGAIAHANHALCDLLGYPPGGLAEKALSDLGEAARPVPAGIRRWRRMDGGAIDLRVRPSADGLTLVLDAIDSDDLVRAEQNRDALTLAGLGEWRWDPASGRVALSRRAAHILGMPAGSSITWRALRGGIAADDAAAIATTLREAATGEPFALESRHRRATDGAPIRLGVRGRATLSAEGAVTGMVGVIQDVTTRVEARDALREREQRLRIAASLAALGIFEWHMLNDHAVWENERMFEIFGRSPDDGPVGKREFLDNILHPDDRVGFRLAISTALRDDSVLQASGRIRRHGDGAWRVIEMAGRFERDAPRRLPRRLVGVIADVTERRLAEERQALLIRELHHRVKNTLSTVQAIVGSTARSATSIESFYDAFVGRIVSLAHTHSVLTEDTWQTASLRALLESELRPYADDEDARDGRISLDGPPVDLASEIAVPIGMAIHELTTNAAKHGALSTAAGRVSITWSVAPDGPTGTLLFDWVEVGGPPVAPPTRQGFGSRLLQRVLTAQVRAEVSTAYPPEGFRLSMRAPLPARNAALNPLA